MRISDWSSDVCASDLLCGQSGSKAHLTEEGTATAAPYSSDEISRHANRSELVDSALDFALQLLAFAFHFLRFSFAAYFRVSALLLDFACSLVGCTFQLVFHFAHYIYLFLICRCLSSAERRVGKDFFSKCKYRWAPYHKK